MVEPVIRVNETGWAGMLSMSRVLSPNEHMHNRGSHLVCHIKTVTHSSTVESCEYHLAL